MASRDPSGQLRLWTIALRQRNLAPQRQGLGTVQVEPPEPLGGASVTFAHLSSNRRGELLVQSGSLEEAVRRLRHAPELSLINRGGGSLEVCEGGDLVNDFETADDTIFNNFGGSSLDVHMICYVQIADWYAFHQEQEAIMLEVMKLVEELGLGFAFPSQSIYIEQMPQPAGEIEQ